MKDAMGAGGAVAAKPDDADADVFDSSRVHRRPAWLELPGLFAWDEIAAMVDRDRGTTSAGEFRAVLSRIHSDGTSLYKVFARG